MVANDLVEDLVLAKGCEASDRRDGRLCEFVWRGSTLPQMTVTVTRV